jgi:hypothetical protein
VTTRRPWDASNSRGAPHAAAPQPRQADIEDLADRVYRLMREEIRLEIARGAAPSGRAGE